MAIYCKGEHCDASTMQRSGFEDGLCDECWEKKNGNVDVLFSQGYAGGVKIEVMIGDAWYVIEKDEVKRVLLKSMMERGYTKSKTPRQKYERININD